MKNLLFFICIFPIWVFGQQIKKDCQCSCNVVLFSKQQLVPILDNNRRVKCYIMDDTIKENYYVLKIKKINRNYVYVSASAAIFDTIPREGWINIKNLGIYPSNFSTINLYNLPQRNSKIKSQLLKPEYYPFNIQNCYKDWLYIKYIDVDKKLKQGWLSPEDQCSNPYSTCN